MSWMVISVVMATMATTPTATVRISTGFGMAGTWVASTVRSGSATVIMIPIIRQIKITSQSFFDFVKCAPIPSPIGIIDISAPREKKPIPIMSRKAPVKNSMMVPIGIGAIVILSNNTIAVIGRTDDSASFVFSFKF